MPPLIGTTGAASSKGFGQFALTNLGPSSWIGFAGIGVSNTSGAMIYNYGYFVDALSNSYWTYFSGTSNIYNIAKVSKNGVPVMEAQPFDSTRLVVYGGKSYSSNEVVPLASAGPYPFNGDCNPQYLTGNLVKQYASTAKYPGNLGGQGYTFQYNKCAAITAGGEFIVSGNIDLGKYGYGHFYMRQAAAGNAIAVMGSSPSNNAHPNLCLTTNGYVIQVSKTGQYIFLSIFTAGDNYVNTRRFYNLSGDTIQECSAVIDSSNNIYVLGRSGFIYRFDSSNNMTHAGRMSAFANDSMASLTEYNGDLFAAVSMSGGTYNGINITCLSSANLSVKWSNRFYLSGVGSGYYLGNGYGSVYATADGVYLAWYVTDINGRNFIMRIPLTGMPSNSSKAVDGTSYTLYWTSQSISNTMDSPGMYSTLSFAFGGKSAFAGKVYSVGSANSSTFTKTTL